MQFGILYLCLQWICPRFRMGARMHTWLIADGYIVFRIWVIGGISLLQMVTTHFPWTESISWVYDYIKYSFCGYFYSCPYVLGYSETETIIYLIYIKTTKDGAGGWIHTSLPVPNSHLKSSVSGKFKHGRNVLIRHLLSICFAFRF